LLLIIIRKDATKSPDLQFGAVEVGDTIKGRAELAHRLGAGNLLGECGIIERWGEGHCEDWLWEVGDEGAEAMGLGVPSRNHHVAAEGLEEVHHLETQRTTQGVAQTKTPSERGRERSMNSWSL
jgi:hypothetical protein